MRTSINKKSDFDFIVLDSKGNAIDMPTSNFTLDLWTWGSKCRFRASSIGGVLKGCKSDNGKLRVYVDNPGFVPGKLVGEWVSYISSEEYPDGTQRTCRYISDFGIDMVDGDSQTNEQQVLAMMQYIQGASAYEIACEYGYQGTEEEWLNSLSLESVNAANECRELMAQLSAAEDVRNANEQTRIANEQARVESEGSRSYEEDRRADAERARIHNESVRYNREEIRQDAENYRITHENSREGYETMRQNSETARAAAEESRVAAEKSRQAAEQARETAEVSRAAAEEERKRTHDRLKTAMREYADAESLREEAEAERREAEQYRIEYEQSRQSAEADRLTNERSRVATESQRVTNETARKDAEDARVANEVARQSAEATRQSNEQSRQTAEQGRVEAEQARAEEFAGFSAAIAAKEDAANKVTSINADATDLQYPSAKAVWSAIEDKFWYGIEKDTTVSTPTCTRIGNMDYHRTLPVQSLMRGCLLADDGTVNKYLDPDDWTNEVRDGSQGQVMVEIPRHFRKFETEGNIIRVKLSLLPLEGFHEVPEMYVSAYEATVQRSTNKLASVCSTDVDYRGGNNNASYDGTYHSFLGLPATSISLNDFRTKARNRGSVEWNCNLYRLHKTLWWLFAVEYANFNSQNTFNAALDENGYRQGGLGAGVTTWDSTWNTFNGYYPIVPCGVTNSLGNHTGTVDYNVIGADGATLKTFAVPRYRGIENPFGHIWKWTDGCKCIIQSEASGGLSKFYVCDAPAKFTASGVGNYDYRGNLPRSEGYVKALILGEDGEIMPLAVGGGSTTYFCDYLYTNIPSSGEAERGVLFGGTAASGANAGFVFANTNHAPTSANANFGSRLCFIPQK